MISGDLGVASSFGLFSDDTSGNSTPKIKLSQYYMSQLLILGLKTFTAMEQMSR